MKIRLARRPPASCVAAGGPPFIQSTDLAAVLPLSLTETPMHLPARADFGIFGAWDGALLSL